MLSFPLPYKRPTSQKRTWTNGFNISRTPPRMDAPQSLPQPPNNPVLCGPLDDGRISHKSKRSTNPLESHELFRARMGQHCKWIGTVCMTLASNTYTRKI